MKLFLLFTKEIDEFKIDSQDFVLSYYPDVVTTGNDLRVESGYFEDEAYFLHMSGLFDKFSCQLKDNLGEVFESNKTIAYRNLQIPFKWINTIKEILDSNNILEIIISDVVIGSEYIPYYESEGEFTRQLLYKSYDFLPDLILQYLRANFRHINISTKQKRSKIRLKLRIFGRRYLLLVVKFLLLLKNFVKYKFGSKVHMRTPTSNPEILFCSRGSAHLQYMHSLIAKRDNYFTHVAEGISSSGQSAKYLNDKPLVGDYYLNLFSLKDLFVCLVETIRLILSAVVLKKNEFAYLGVKLNLNSLLREMIIHQFDVKVYERNIKRCLQSAKSRSFKIKVIVSPEIYTPYAFVIAKLAKLYGFKSLQVQTTEMRVIKRPNFIYCDKFVFSNKQKLAELLERIPHQADLGDFWGNPTINLLQQELYPIENNISVVVYTQPRVEEEYDHIIINNLISLKKGGLPIDIYIKPHPRELPEKFEKYGSYITVYDPSVSIDESLVNKHLAFIKHSSVDSLILQNGRVPILYCLITKAARLYKLNHLTEAYQGTITDIDELEQRLINIHLIRDDYNKFKMRYYDFFYANKDCNEFHERLMKFLKS